MSHPFNYAEVPGTCLWCGRKLRPYRFRDKSLPREEWPLGDYGDGHFCGLTCGYRFGKRLADLGKRLLRGGDST